MNTDLDQTDLTDMYRTLHPKSTEYTFFSAPHGTYSKINHIIGSKILLNKCKRTEIITVSQKIGNQIRIQDLKNHSKPHNYMDIEQPPPE